MAFTVDGVLLTKMRAAFPKVIGHRTQRYGKRDASQAPSVRPCMDTYLANPCGNLYPQNSGSRYSHLRDSQEGNTTTAPTAKVGATKGPSHSLIVLWLPPPLFCHETSLVKDERDQREILSFLTSVNDWPPLRLQHRQLFIRALTKPL